MFCKSNCRGVKQTEPCTRTVVLNARGPGALRGRPTPSPAPPEPTSHPRRVRLRRVGGTGRGLAGWAPARRLFGCQQGCLGWGRAPGRPGGRAACLGTWAAGLRTHMARASALPPAGRGWWRAWLSACAGETVTPVATDTGSSAGLSVRVRLLTQRLGQPTVACSMSRSALSSRCGW